MSNQYCFKCQKPVKSCSNTTEHYPCFTFDESQPVELEIEFPSAKKILLVLQKNLIIILFSQTIAKFTKMYVWLMYIVNLIWIR